MKDTSVLRKLISYQEHQMASPDPSKKDNETYL